MNSRAKAQTATTLLAHQIDKLKIDSAFLRMRSREIPDGPEAETLQLVAEKITELTRGIEQLVGV
jgi:hypothetical protein